MNNEKINNLKIEKGRKSNLKSPFGFYNTDQHQATEIRCDLHIHSIYSFLKGQKDEDIVKNSTMDSVDLLLKELEDNHIGLFSITDHNSFSYDLFKSLREKIYNSNFKYVKNNIAGVEFDVSFDEWSGEVIDFTQESRKKCHVLVYFEIKEEQDAKNLEKILDKNRFDLEKSYSITKFEEILKHIGLNTILIACQRSPFESSNHDKENSLSACTNEYREIIGVGYIDGLEYKSSAVRSLLVRNLHKFNLKTSLIVGSDCHDWKNYPFHDKYRVGNINNYNYYFDSYMIPTFKGLLLSISSPSSRLNRPYHETQYDQIKAIIINNQRIELSNRINAIIGENGSGKSSLLLLMENPNTSTRYLKDIKKTNSIDFENDNIEKIKCVPQGFLTEKYKKNEIEQALQIKFPVVDINKFKESFKKFSESLFEYLSQVSKNNSIKENFKNISNLQLNLSLERVKNFYCSLNNDIEKLELDGNELNEDITLLNSILENTNDLMRSKNLNAEEKEKIKSFRNVLLSIVGRLKGKKFLESIQATVFNLIVRQFNEYKNIVSPLESAKTQEKENYLRQKNNFILNFISYIKALTIIPKFPKLDLANCNGKEKFHQHGFNFYSIASFYDDQNIEETFCNFIFKKEKQINDFEDIKRISTMNEFFDSIKNLDSRNKSGFICRVDAFINEETKIKNVITEGIDNQKEIGKTLGEESLMFYKFSSSADSDFTTFIIDQPEDNISNFKIANELTRYFSILQNKKQIIYATHNPILVVNMDVDTVLFLKMDKDYKLEVQYGALEYENETYSILDTICRNMDGGKEMIKQRLKFYDQNN